MRWRGSVLEWTGGLATVTTGLSRRGKLNAFAAVFMGVGPSPPLKKTRCRLTLCLDPNTYCLETNDNQGSHADALV